MTYDLVAFELETNKEVLHWFGVLATRRFRAGTWSWTEISAGTWLGFAIRVLKNCGSLMCSSRIILAVQA